MQSDGYMQSRQTVGPALMCHWPHVTLSSAGLKGVQTRTHKHDTQAGVLTDTSSFETVDGYCATKKLAFWQMKAALRPWTAVFAPTS